MMDREYWKQRQKREGREEKRINAIADWWTKILDEMGDMMDGEVSVRQRWNMNERRYEVAAVLRENGIPVQVEPIESAEQIPAALMRLVEKPKDENDDN